MIEQLKDIRCDGCNKKLGESPNETRLIGAHFSKENVIYKTKCPRCKKDIIVQFNI